MKTELTDEQKKVKILEACGWKHCPQSGDKFTDPDAYWYPPNPYTPPGWREPAGLLHLRQLPDPLNNLNAMHEAERLFHPDHILAWEYANTLEGIVLKTKHSGTGLEFQLLNATARQRAEAFLRVIGGAE